MSHSGKTKQRTDMVHDAKSCPLCSCQQIEGHQYSQDDHSVWQEMTCTNCDAEWNNVFVYSSSTVEISVGDTRQISTYDCDSRSEIWDGFGWVDNQPEDPGKLYEIVTRRTDLVTRDYVHRVLANSNDGALYKFENGNYEPVRHHTVERRRGDGELYSVELIDITSQTILIE